MGQLYYCLQGKASLANVNIKTSPIIPLVILNEVKNLISMHFLHKKSFISLRITEVFIFTF